MSQTVAVPCECKHMSVMNKPVDERGGEPAVVNHRVPLSELKVCGDGHTSALLAASDYLKQELSCVTVQGQEAQFIHDEQIA